MTDVIRPRKINKFGVQVDCPTCKDVHNYGLHELRPLPIKPGDRRMVRCKFSRSRSDLFGTGMRGVPLLPFLIQFPTLEQVKEGRS
ncbi:hypothetical protein ACQ3I4_11215 [Zafaria sp. Z1313]|uniref:hypothetical protein n=1 Tax=Zafaria sp. Z1313 TaxID=3423202 RepID=UPI003D303A87